MKARRTGSIGHAPLASTYNLETRAAGDSSNTFDALRYHIGNTDPLPTDLKAPRFEILEYQPAFKAQWDGLVRRAVNSSLIHFRDYMEYHQDRFQERSILITRGDRTVAIFPAEVEGTEVHSYRGLTFAGPIFDSLLESSSYGEVVRLIIGHYRDQGFSRVSLQPVPDFYWRNSGFGSFQLALQNQGGATAGLRIFDTASLPYSVTDPVKKWGRRKAEKLGLQVAGAHTVGLFWDEVLVPNLRDRYQVDPVHSKVEINLLCSRFPESIQLWTVQRDGQLVAGCLLYLHGPVMHSQYISSTAEGRKLRALDLLFSTLLETVGPNFQFLSLGTSVDPTTGLRNLGLVKWKESWGTKAMPVSSWSFQLD